MKKALKLTILGVIFTYNDIKIFFSDIYRGRPVLSGSILFGPNTNAVRLKVIENLNKQENLFAVYGDGRNSMYCENLELLSNHIYLYEHKNNHNSDICFISENEILNTLSNSVKISSYYLKLIGYNQNHFEFIGYTSVYNPTNLQDKISNLTAGSTIIAINSSSSYIAEELLLEGFFASTSSPYLRYLYYITACPESIIIAIKLNNEAKIFETEIEKLIPISDASILEWQKNTIFSFVDFINSIIDDIPTSVEKSDFQKFTNSYSSIEELLGKINFSVNKYKQLLAFSYIVKEQKEELASLLKTGLSIDDIYLNSGITLLYAALSLGKLSMVNLLCERGVNVDAAIKDNATTPLLYSSFRNYIDVAESLINWGANPNIKDVNGNSPLILASSKGNIEIVKLLIKANAKLDEQNNSGNTALIKAYLARKANNQIEDKNGKTADLKKTYLSLIELLLKNGANPYIFNKKNQSLLSIAKLDNELELIEILMKYNELDNTKIIKEDLINQADEEFELVKDSKHQEFTNNQYIEIDDEEINFISNPILEHYFFN